MTTIDLVRRRCLAVLGTALAPSIGEPKAPAAAAADAPPLLLATDDDGRIDPSRYLVSEKYDGVRALWDGRTLRHRSGRPIAAPEAFLAALPQVTLDGELWLGRRRFDALSATVRRSQIDAAAWQSIRYMVFELPGAAGTFADRAERMVEIAGRATAGPMRVASQVRGTDRIALHSRLDAVVAGGGEGLMLHLASASFVSGRSDVLVKLKPQFDAEAVVIGHRPGKGRHRGATGALEVRDEDGRRFFVGSGLDDALRHTPPPIGSRITYRYRGRTPNGLPRFATWLRRFDAW